MLRSIGGVVGGTLRRMAGHPAAQTEPQPTRLVGAVGETWMPPDGLPLPSPELHFLVSGSRELDPSSFWQIGRDCLGWIRALMAEHGVRIDDLQAILDFGCGS